MGTTANHVGVGVLVMVTNRVVDLLFESADRAGNVGCVREGGAECAAAGECKLRAVFLNSAFAGGVLELEDGYALRRSYSGDEKKLECHDAKQVEE